MWEDTWASEFSDTVRGAQGVMLEGARIPAQLIDAAFADLVAAGEDTDR